MTKFLPLVAAAAIIAIGVASPPVYAAKSFGCFKVLSDLNIRARPYSTAEVTGQAAKGDILEKRKRWCTLRGYWCAVRTKAGLEGYADKAFMEKAACP